MTYRAARHYADKILEWLRPSCERIEVAGSVRRECATCNNIDVVYIPGPPHALWEFLCGYVRSTGRGQWENPNGSRHAGFEPMPHDRSEERRVGKECRS